jgi:hypothetical protein
VTGPTKSFTTAAASGPPPPPPPPATKPPKSRIVGLPHKVKSKKLKRIHGTASDPDDAVARVDVAVTRTTGRAHAAAAARCLRLTSRGTLKSSRPKKGICAPLFLRASGTKSWKFVLKKRLRKGVYVVYSRATDAAGHREVRFTSANRKSVRVR